MSLGWKDVSLFFLMGILAACGILYEYLISHYAGRVLGSLETVIYSVIGLMIVSMGLGAFLARCVPDPYKGFAYLETVIAFFGMTSIVVIGYSVGFSEYLPRIMAELFGLPSDVLAGGAISQFAEKVAAALPFVFAFILGLLIGIEIPLIARIREDLYQKHLANNAGSIYGADYIGAGLGAFFWVFLLIGLPSTESAVIISALNLMVGLTFAVIFRHKLGKAFWALLIIHVCLSAGVLLIHCNGKTMQHQMESLLYRDSLVKSIDTPYQHISITKKQHKNMPDNMCFFINGHNQFCSRDQHAYHSMMVSPAMHAAGSPQRILIIGGGDGLALNEVLKWPGVTRVDLVDLDSELIDFFANTSRNDNTYFTELNEQSFSNPKAHIHYGDAFRYVVDTANQHKQHFDVILIDLPDPSHPNLNKLYSTAFYQGIYRLLNENGVVAIQSTSPHFAKPVFLSIANTLEASGFAGTTSQYQQNIPSFGGSWGWTIAGKGSNPKETLTSLSQLKVEDNFMTPELLKAAFAFSNGYFDDKDSFPVNHLGTGTLYTLHVEAWKNYQ